LKSHKGLARDGVNFPDSRFLTLPEAIPEAYFGPEVRAYLGLPKNKSKRLVRELKVPKKVIDAYKDTR
jgi:hypothetical protein